MTRHLTDIKITNFKSLKSCAIEGCKRINLLIGKPNVGKSNILEALSLFSLPFLTENKSRSLTQLVRVENPTELFSDGDFFDGAYIETNRGLARLSYDRFSGLDIFIDIDQLLERYSFDEHLNMRYRRKPYDSPIKKYAFSHNPNFSKSHAKYLIPPFGANLLDVVEQNEQLKHEITSWFKDYGLSLVFDRASQSLKIIQPTKVKEAIFLIPYNSVADTLQRMIFFKTAIVSNSNSVLLFEEPEAHSYPPFIAKITQEMIYNESNQYFIATHSPFIISDFLENAREELAIYLVDYQKSATKAKLLSEKELHEIYQSGVDLLTNNESYI